MLIIGIETTCDETACAVVRDGKEILSNVIASQIDVHRLYGGVFPEIASRQHCELIIPVIESALKEANIPISAVDGIAVAKGPGLIGPLLIGLNAAKAIAYAWNKPLIGVNHVEAHLYAAMMEHADRPFPALGVVLSGGHTFISLIHDIGSYEVLSTTVDDAVGEAFDKVAKMLELPYPGGPQIEKIAIGQDTDRYKLKAGFVKERPLDFSLSGIKTGVLNLIQKIPKEKLNDERPFIAAAFQKTVFEDIAKKIDAILATTQASTIYFGGGVCCNMQLRTVLKGRLPQEVDLRFAPPSLCLDNAVMIAGLGNHKLIANPQGDNFSLQPMTRIPFSSH